MTATKRIPYGQKTGMTSKCCERLVWQAVSGVNLGRKRRPARSDPGGFRRRLLPLAGSAQTIGGRVTEMDTSTPPSDGSIGANRQVARGI